MTNNCILLASCCSQPLKHQSRSAYSAPRPHCLLPPEGRGGWAALAPLPPIVSLPVTLTAVLSTNQPEPTRPPHFLFAYVTVPSANRPQPAKNPSESHHHESLT